jgi:hypothetical protein
LEELLCQAGSMSSTSIPAAPSEAEKISAAINEALPNLKTGTLCFWGQWFGRPYDNVHQVTACDAEKDLLLIHFNEGEILNLWSPQQATTDHQTFRIEKASRVRWEWFYYGRWKTEQNRYFMDFTGAKDRIDASTNVDSYTPNLQPTLQAPAVEIL